MLFLLFVLDEVYVCEVRVGVSAFNEFNMTSKLEIEHFRLT